MLHRMEPLKKLNMDRLSWIHQAQDGIEADDPWFVHLIAHWDKPERFRIRNLLARVLKQKNLEELLIVTVIFLLIFFKKILT